MNWREIKVFMVKDIKALWSSKIVYLLGAYITFLYIWVSKGMVEYLGEQAEAGEGIVVSTMVTDSLIFWLIIGTTIPIITMGAIGDEKKSHCWEILKSIPVNMGNCVIGKFLARWLTAVIIWLPIIAILAIIFAYLGLFWGQWLCCTAVIVGVSSVVTSWGLWCSAYISHRMSTCLVTIVGCVLGLVGVHRIFGNQAGYENISMIHHCLTLGDGIISTSGVLFFIGVSIWFLWGASLKLSAEARL